MTESCRTKQSSTLQPRNQIQSAYHHQNAHHRHPAAKRQTPFFVQREAHAMVARQFGKPVTIALQSGIIVRRPKMDTNEQMRYTTNRTHETDSGRRDIELFN